MNNERGGILSKIVIVPAGVALMVCFFFLGYTVGKYQNKSGATAEMAPPLPEMASSASHTAEEFTFYKTLTDKNDKTVSIDVKPKPAKAENTPGKQQASLESHKAIPAESAPREKRIEIKIEKEPSTPDKHRPAATKQPQPPASKGPAADSTGPQHRYTVQTASYQEKEMAEDEVKRLKKRGYAAFITSSEVPGKGMWHRVRLGSFLNKVAAEKLQKTLQAKEGVSPIVVIE